MVLEGCIFGYFWHITSSNTMREKDPDVRRLTKLTISFHFNLSPKKKARDKCGY